MFSCMGIRNSMRQCIMWWLIVFVVSCWYAEISASDIQVAYDFETSRVITPKKKFNITCILVDAPLAHIKWYHNEKEVVVKENVISIVEKSPEFQLIIEKPTDADTGNYSCQAYQNKTLLKSKDILVVSLPTASLDADSIVVEDEKLTLDCHPTGRPIPEVKWLVRGDYVLNGTGNTSRITGLPSNNIPNGKLRISSAMMSDRGEYKCIVSNIVNTNMNISEAVAVTVVRVKDKLAALWPFLGICAEVFVLCAIILIYEKKRNKAELDESDTDNSPEQKNTPDHGKDSVRQRK